MLGSGGGRHRRVLLIDDNDDIREVGRLALERTGGVTVHTAGNGRDGVALAREHLPDVVLLDVRMPDLDGPSTLALLREDPRTAELPVVLLTAQSPPDGRRRYEELGVVGVIEKPFDAPRLGSQLRRLLGW